MPEIPIDRAIQSLEGGDQQHRVDQGGPVKPRERFAGGNNKNPTKLYGSLKAVDPATGEIKATRKLDYPNLSGALATAGNLVFIGEPDGTFAAYDAKTRATMIFDTPCTVENDPGKDERLAMSAGTGH